MICEGTPCGLFQNQRIEDADVNSDCKVLGERSANRMLLVNYGPSAGFESGDKLRDSSSATLHTYVHDDEVVFEVEISFQRATENKCHSMSGKLNGLNIMPSCDTAILPGRRHFGPSALG